MGVINATNDPSGNGIGSPFAMTMYS
jgi:hypothetical protein